MKILKRIMLNFRNKIVQDKENSIVIHDTAKLNGCRIKIRGNNNKIIIEKNVSLNKVILEIRGIGCNIIIGEETVIGKNTYITSKEKNIKVEIGKRCMLSRNIIIMASDGHGIFQNGQKINKAENIKIGNDVWLADKVIVLKGSLISDGTVIGIGSIITKKINEKNVMLAGIPAKIIKKNIMWRK